MARTFQNLEVTAVVQTLRVTHWTVRSTTPAPESVMIIEKRSDAFASLLFFYLVNVRDQISSYFSTVISD